MPKITVYDVANDISNQLYLLGKDIEKLRYRLDAYFSMEYETYPDELSLVHKRLNEVESYTKKLYNEYQCLAAKTINNKGE
jgi:hypothetical protein